jgi:hypothetical protein
VIGAGVMTVRIASCMSVYVHVRHLYVHMKGGQPYEYASREIVSASP